MPNRRKNNKKASYEGTPDDWEQGKPTMSMRNINQANNKENCVNCSVAYEMHRRGYPNVVSGKEDEYLKKNPFSVWKSPIVIEADNGESIIETVERAFKYYGKDARLQVALLEKNPIIDSGLLRGHVINAEFRDNKLVFVDSQNRKLYYADKDLSFLDRYDSRLTQLCRIDNLEISDLGVKACKSI